MTLPSITASELVAVFGSMAEGLQVIDREWRYAYVNATAAEHGRRDAQELLGRTMMECFPGIEATPLFRALERCMERREPAMMENEFRYPDGQSRTFDLRIAPCEAGITVLSIDITEKKHLERQLRHAQKMEAIGRLAGSIAHDFNNLLTVILGHAGMALLDTPEGSPLLNDLNAIKWAGERASELTKKLLTMSRQQVVEPRIVDLNRLLDESERMLRRLIGEDVVLMVHKGHTPKIMVDPGQIEQVLMNLVVNARDAMPDGGQLTIETAQIELDASYVDLHFGVKAGTYAMLSVSDSGMGMDANVQARIFEPFFTTKEAGKGTGLGLSTVFGIVKQCGGGIYVYSEPGVGTTFKVYLPETAQKRVRVVTMTNPATLRGTETILLSEDQAEVRAITRSILERFGYKVLEAASAEEAIALSKAYLEPIDLLLTDVVMPLMNGRELARLITQERPGLKVLYMSGYTDVAVIQQALLDPGTAYIQKPLAHEPLARKVRQVLETRRET